MPTEPNPTYRVFDEAIDPDLANETVDQPTEAGLDETDPDPEALPVARPMPEVPGYEIEHELGRGAMGVVYKARQTKLNRAVALKVLLSGEHAGERELARFRQEAEAAAQIQHPNVMQVFDVGECNGVSYIASEYAGGGDLHAWLAGKPLPVLSAVKLIYTLARAVGAAHKKGIVHRDLKPKNILITGDGVPKVADFGLAKVLGEAGQTTTGAILGTPYYMSPEQAQGQAKRVGPPTDVYSLGVMLYECLAGRVPFSGTSVLDTLDQVRNEQPIPVQEFRADIPAPLAVVVRRCLSKVPEERYRTGDDLADDLARLVAGGVNPEKRGFPAPGWLLPVVGVVAGLILGWVLLSKTGLFERRAKPPAETQQKAPALKPGELEKP